MFMTVFGVFLASDPMVREFLIRPAPRALGYCSFMMALITPQMIELNIMSVINGNYLSLKSVTFLGAANIVIIFVTSVFFYLLV
jgi:hypothetical protein